jgi:hypothetical protein
LVTTIPDRDWPERSFYNIVQLDWSIDGEDISRIIRNIGANKAPGEDILSNSFLKAYNREGALTRVLVKITNAYFTLEHFLRRF